MELVFETWSESTTAEPECFVTTVTNVSTVTTSSVATERTEAITTELTPIVTTEEPETFDVEWEGKTLNSFDGVVSGPSGQESYYNLDMTGVIAAMKSLGYDYAYQERQDGVKTLGGYVMVAVNDLNARPKGTIIDTTLGKAIVCDKCEIPGRVDVAVNW